MLKVRVTRERREGLPLAVPIAHVVASGALMRAGMLVKDGSAIERLARVDMVLLDKTGTTTLGRLVPTAGMPDDAASCVSASVAGQVATSRVGSVIRDACGKQLGPMLCDGAPQRGQAHTRVKIDRSDERTAFRERAQTNRSR